MSDASRDQSRILLFLADDRNRRLLAEWLRDDPAYAVRLATDTKQFHCPFDLCILDRASLRRGLDDLLDAKRERHPVFHPYVLLAPEEVADDTLPPRVQDVVDEVVTTPVRKGHLSRRLSVLLRSRNLSLDLVRSRNQYESLVEVLPEGVLIVADGAIAYANTAATDILGASRSTLQGTGLIERVDDADRAAVRSLLEAARDGADSQFHDVTLDTDDGPVPAALAAVPVDFEGEPALQVVVRDLTETRERQRTLALYQRAMDEADLGITIADATRPDQPLVYVNRGFTEVTGYQPSEALGENCRFLQGPDTDPAVIDGMRTAIAEERSTSVVVLNYRKDGTPFWNHVDLTPIHGADGSVTHFLGFQRDVTDRRERRQELLRYETIVDTAGDPIYTLDEEGRFTQVNGAMVSFSGYDRGDLIGTELSALLADSDAAAHDELLDALSSPAGARSIEVTVVTAGGQRRLCELNVAALSADSSVGHSVGVLHDITDRIHRQERLSVLDRVLRHNLRNQLSVVLGRAELIDGSPDDHEHAAAIIDAVETLYELSQKAQRLHSADQAGDSFDVVAAVERVVETHRASYSGVTLTTALPDEAWAAGGSELEFAIDEVVRNAIEHNDADDPWVSVSVSVAGDRVVLTVSDNGPGLPDSEQVALDSTLETPMEHASGLGLWLVAWFVREVGGSVDYEPNDPRGSTLRLALPAADAPTP